MIPTPPPRPVPVPKIVLKSKGVALNVQQSYASWHRGVPKK